jgi:hypothetical protein
VRLLDKKRGLVTSVHVIAALRGHVARQWPDHKKISEERWMHGPVSSVMPELRVVVAVAKVSGEPCVYVTCGASDIAMYTSANDVE